MLAKGALMPAGFACEGMEGRGAVRRTCRARWPGCVAVLLRPRLSGWGSCPAGEERIQGYEVPLVASGEDLGGVAPMREPVWILLAHTNSTEKEKSSGERKKNLAG